ncbi:MAG: hypothetical protein Q8P56_06515 [Candidatus Uhrbacteria bacterium]|nr:hypothetical protein [Candidatus Uhrbacteria bacterium]
MKKFAIENITFFGDGSRAVVQADCDLLAANPTNEYHILRHYSDMPKAYTDSLVGKEYEYYNYETRGFTSSIISQDDIQTAFQTKGSKFYNDVSGLENPHKIIEYIKEELRARIGQGNMFWICKPTFDFLIFSITYSENVGDKDFVTVDSLSHEQQARIKMVPRSTREEVMFRTVSGVAKMSTNRFVVEIHHFPGKQFAYMTAYPGEVGPPFPDSNQSVEEYEYNKRYTESHVFIE